MVQHKLSDQIKEAADRIRRDIRERPEAGLILGSGLGVAADLIERPIVIPFGEIPHFPVSTVEGHAGELVIGELEGKRVITMKGRFHQYEGYTAEQVAFPVRVMKALGVATLLVTNAAGGINPELKPGDLMLIRDHLNLMFRSPLAGPNEAQLGVRFPDMSEAYAAKLRALAKRVAERQGLELHEGVYAGVLGPSYETPAEIRMLRALGADVVGMSTVPEVIAARHAGIDVVGVSCVSNLAAGIGDRPLSHDEVMETTEREKPKFLRLVLGLIGALERGDGNG